MTSSASTSLGRFTVGLIGLVESDIALLRHIFDFTCNTERMRSYELIESEEDGGNANIIIVNADNQLAVDFWMSKQDDSGNAAPMVFAAKERPGEADYHIKTPFFPSRVLKVLDEVTVKEWKYVPELTIGGGHDQGEGALTIDDVRTFTERKKAEVGDKSALIVSGSELIREQIAAELSLLGISAEARDTPDGAIQALEAGAGRYHVIFVQTTLSGIGGYQLCKNIKRDPKFKRPVILLSSSGSPIERVRAMLSGANDYVELPVDITKFESIILEHMES